MEYDWDSLTAPLLGIWAEHDDMVNPQLPGFARELASRKHDFHFKTYTGTSHGFFNDTNTGGHDVNASTDAWDLALNWFEKYL